LNYRESPSDKNNIARYLFGGFKRCLYPVQKFQSDSERKLAIILERDSMKWFKPVRGQFQIYYHYGSDYPEYQPDFVAEANNLIYMLEPKRHDEMESKEVQAKKEVAVQWCTNASAYSKTYGGKPWKYVLIPHDVITENMTLEILSNQYGVRDSKQLS
jgi:type III restriction enzyme